jgi:hypothetical protein
MRHRIYLLQGVLTRNMRERIVAPHSEATRGIEMATRDELRNHNCFHDDSWVEYDARGIALCRVCNDCRAVKLAKYRPEVLTDSSYQTFGETLYAEDY